MNGKISRRDFLRKSARGAAFCIAAPYILRGGVLSAPGRPGPNDRIGVGHIGVGGMGSGHLGHYARNPSFPTVAVCDVDERHRLRAAGSVGEKCAVYKDYRELLDNKDVDAVVIATPDHWHALHAIHACEAGKDVYCEKPLSLTIEEARAMVRAARRYGRVFQTGSQQRSSNEFRLACTLVRSGRIGKIHTVRVGVWGTSQDCYLPAEPTPEGMDWDMWIGAAPWRPYNRRLHPGAWRAYRDYSGGTMTDWGAHHLDIAQWGLGMSYSGPVEILPPEGKEFVTYQYANGVVVLCGQVGANGVLFEGTEGKIEVNRGHFRTWPEEIGKEPLGPGDVELYTSPGQQPDWQKEEISAKDWTAAAAYKSPGHHGDWQNCIRARKRPICDVEIGCRSVTVCHLGNVAIWLGRKLHWDPEKERFVGDEQANRWLHRPMRAPWHL